MSTALELALEALENLVPKGAYRVGDQWLTEDATGYTFDVSEYASSFEAIAALKEEIKQQGEPVAITRTGFRLEWCEPYYGLVNGEAIEHPDGTPLYAYAEHKGEQP